ncbi:MAG: NAD-dependent epimerase/dehydratase family protein [Flavobacteriales bacterium]
MNLVTGATGLLGTHMLIELLQRQEKVRALKRADSNTNMVLSVFKFYKAEQLFEKIEWVEGDVLDADSLLSAMTDCDHVYHCAAVVSYHKADRQLMYKVNVEGTANVVNAAIEMKTKKLCFVSSIAALGKVKDGDVLNEQNEWKDSDYNTHYGITKHLSELEVWRGVQEGLNAIVVNPGFIIGPGDASRSSASVFRKLNEGLAYYPPGGTGFVAATDCSKMMVDLTTSEVHNERFILVAENLSMKYLFQKVAVALGKKSPEKSANNFIIHWVRMAEWMKEKLTGQKALITRESARNTSVRFYYENEKVKRRLQVEFRKIDNAIQQTAEFFKSK